jgi:eukaryotic-like serine/threonine-protein kinase
MPLPPGTRLGPYEIVAPIGAGGMGEVYRARDTRLRREVALKILPGDVSDDPTRRARFEHEAHAAATLNHPNILSVYDIGGDDHTSYIAAELVSGETLAALIERGPLPVRALLDIAVQIADGLSSAHAAHVVHRDLKPANVMITTDGRVKILDFGLAKRTIVNSGRDETIAANQTVAGMIVGTVHYMSPEQASGKAVDHRSDQFSFGLMLYEMASGKKAFDESVSVQTLSAIISKEPAPLDARLPAPLRWIIDRCLSKQPDSRYDSSRDLFHELRSLREHLSEISTQILTPAAVSQPARRRGAWYAAAAFVLGVALTIALAVARLGPSLPDPSAYRFTPFSSAAGGQTSPVFSTDGKAVAYSAGQTSSVPYQVFVRYLDAPTAMQLTDLPTAAFPIGWSPDSNRVLFVTRGDSPAVWSVAIAGGEPQQLLPLPTATADLLPSGATISTDNALAAYLTRSEQGLWGVATVALPGGSPARYSIEPFSSDTLYNSPVLRFSPDRKQLALFLNRGRNEEAWLLKVPEQGAAGVRRIEPALPGYGGTPTADWMPDNRHLVVSFQSTRRSVAQLWLLDSVSGERHAITSGTRAASGPTVAPAGDKLVFREANRNLDIVSLDLATGTATTLIGTERDETMPAWARSEQAMVYVTDRNGPSEIWLRRGGAADRPLVSDRDFSGDSGLWFMTPTLSPRGDRVIYTRIPAEAPARLWISAVNGGSPIRATTAPPESGAEFPGAWSPDGAWFVYLGLENGKVNLMKVKTTGESTPVLIKANLDDNARRFSASLPDWSPTGEWIVCYNTLFSPEGKTQRALDARGSPHLTFSSDGKVLYGLRQQDGRQTLFTIDVATGAEHAIASTPGVEPISRLTPSIHFSLAPDGKSFVYSAGPNTNSLWILEGFRPPNTLAARLGWRR